mgnify:CR=1 FL=1
MRRACPICRIVVGAPQVVPQGGQVLPQELDGLVLLPEVAEEAAEGPGQHPDLVCGEQPVVDPHLVEGARECLGRIEPPANGVLVLCEDETFDQQWIENRAPRPL